MSVEILNLTEANFIDIESYKAIDPTEWAALPGKISTGVAEANYRLVGSDALRPATIRIGVYDNKATRNTSIRLETFVKNDIDADDVKYEECSVVLAFNMPKATGYVPDSADFVALAQNVLSVLIQSVTSGVADTDIADMIKFGIPNLLG